jgi:hypothetical protein
MPLSQPFSTSSKAFLGLIFACFFNVLINSAYAVRVNNIIKLGWSDELNVIKVREGDTVSIRLWKGNHTQSVVLDGYDSTNANCKIYKSHHAVLQSSYIVKPTMQLNDNHHNQNDPSDCDFVFYLRNLEKKYLKQALLRIVLEPK